MFKKYFLWCVLILTSFHCKAQDLTVSPAQLNFGTVDELTTDSLMITLTNNSTHDIHVTSCRFYTTYGQPAFSTLNSAFTVNAGSSQQLWVRFNPLHNIFHNSELVIENDGHRGYVRVDLHAQGHYSKSYYDSTENLSEEALKAMIHTITGQGYVALGYSAGGAFTTCARDTMWMVIDNQAVNGQGATQNTIECVYTGRQIVGYVNRTQCQNTADPYYNFNTEHTFPQSFFSQQEPMRSDLFHLYPTDNPANNIRSDHPFGVVTNPTWTSGGSKYANSVFEPRDAHKGEVARAMFYFVLRYQNYANYLDSQEVILRQWHHQFPTTPVEEYRCNAIAGYQHNRNPFIDYPQLVDRITNFSQSPSVAAADYSVDFTQDSMNYGTINTGTNYLYQYVIVNNGNQPQTFTGFSLSPSNQLSFGAGFGADTTLQPGEALVIPVLLNTSTPGSFLGNVQCLTSAIPVMNMLVPITADVQLVGLHDLSFLGDVKVSPNPFNDRICLGGTLPMNSTLRLTDLQGRIVFTSRVASSDYCMQDLPVMNAGMYVMTLQSGNQEMHWLMEKQ